MDNVQQGKLRTARFVSPVAFTMVDVYERRKPEDDVSRPEELSPPDPDTAAAVRRASWKR